MPVIKSDGSVYFRQKDKKWVASIVIGKKENGRPDRKVFYGNSEREVKAKLKAYKEEMARHDYVNVIKTDVATFMRDWLHNELAISLKPKSYDTKEYVIEKLVIPIIGSIQVSSLTKDDIRRMVKTLSKTYARSTVKKAYDAVNQCFRKAIEDQVLYFNPCTGVNLPREDDSNTKEIRFFTAEEMERILAAADETYPTGTPVCRLGKAIHLIYYTGMRAGEAIALTWKDIDFENRLIYINKNSVNVKNRNREDESQPKNINVIQNSAKTFSSKRPVPMSQKAEAALRSLRELNGDSLYVLATSTGRPISIRALEKMFHGCQNRANIEPHGTLHSLRHSFASRLIEKKVDIKVISEILGHKDVTVTYNTYVHIIQAVKMQAVTQLDEI